LTNENGFENIMSNLEILSKKIDFLVDEVLDFSDEVPK
jgi:tetrahydromethanopterin S-methyltransferase subunit G